MVRPNVAKNAFVLKNIDKIRSEVGMVFQHFNLFPHMTVLENVIEGPMTVQRKPRGEARLRCVALQLGGEEHLPSGLHDGVQGCGERV